MTSACALLTARSKRNLEIATSRVVLPSQALTYVLFNRSVKEAKKKGRALLENWSPTTIRAQTELQQNNPNAEAGFYWEFHERTLKIVEHFATSCVFPSPWNAFANTPIIRLPPFVSSVLTFNGCSILALPRKLVV